jgi:hypothetical protein
LAGGPDAPAGWAIQDAEQRADRKRDAHRQPGVEVRPAPRRPSRRPVVGRPSRGARAPTPRSGPDRFR